MNLITIITPYFKKKKYIKETILTILDQTYTNFELIIIYDDIDKNDLAYLNEIKKLDKRISIIVNEKNMGAGISRNIAINQANGDYIAFIDSDDIWKKDKLEKQINFMKINNFLISHTSYEIVDEKNKIISKRKARNFSHFSELLKSCDIGLSTVMLQRKIITRECCFAETRTKEDFVLWLKILKNNYIIGGLDENLTSWKKLNNSLSSSSIQKITDGFLVYFRYMGFGFFKSIYYLFCLSINYLKK